MRAAISLARRAEGRTAENPPVGCVILDRQGRLAGSGWTASGGRPHAETQALGMAAGRAAGGTAYVTLEPCSHHGKTPPCAEALIAAGIRRCVIQICDPDRRVNGQGVARLQAAGLEVVTAGPDAEAPRMLAGFFCRQKTGRPWVTVKMAVSKDGFAAISRDRQSWLTGDLARLYVHDLRSRCDGILTGIGTVLADDPALNCRPPLDPADSPPCYVMDSHLRLPADARLLDVSGQRPVTVFCGEQASQKAEQALRQADVQIIRARGARPSPAFVLDQLGAQGINHLLIEAGPALAAAFVGNRLADQVIVITADRLLRQGIAASNDPERLDFPSRSAYMLESDGSLGSDRLGIWIKKD